MIPASQPLLDGNERRYLQECIDSGWISSEGPFVERLEGEFSRRVDCRYGIAVCNGTAALELAVAASGLGPGDEVILPTFTIISCAAAIVRAGATPVPVDVDRETWNMDPQAVAAAVTTRTRAIMAVHIYGLPVDMDPILAIARRHGLAIIEDAAQAHGQHYRDRPCGSLGTIATFSFYANKHLTTGEGGMVVTSDARLAERCRFLRNLCFRPGQRFVHTELGWNYRMSNLQAAVGVAQLERLDDFVARKRHIGARYREKLAGVAGIALAPARVDYAENHNWAFGVVLDEAVSGTAHAVLERLAARKIAGRPFFWPMHEQPVFRDRGWFLDTRCPQAERIARRGLTLPSGVALTDAQIDVVTDALKEVLACS